MMFLQVEHMLNKEGLDKIRENAQKRMAGAILPALRQIGIEDRENNKVYHTIAHVPQLDDVVKACRKIGIVAKPFDFDKPKYD